MKTTPCPYALLRHMETIEGVPESQQNKVCFQTTSFMLLKVYGHLKTVGQMLARLTVIPPVLLIHIWPSVDIFLMRRGKWAAAKYPWHLVLPNRFMVSDDRHGLIQCCLLDSANTTIDGQGSQSGVDGRFSWSWSRTGVLFLTTNLRDGYINTMVSGGNDLS